MQYNILVVPSSDCSTKYSNLNAEQTCFLVFTWSNSVKDCIIDLKNSNNKKIFSCIFVLQPRGVLLCLQKQLLQFCLLWNWRCKARENIYQWAEVWCLTNQEAFALSGTARWQVSNTNNKKDKFLNTAAYKWMWWRMTW